MDSQEQGLAAHGQEVDLPPSENDHQPRSLAISERGIRTGADFANVMSALISDLIAGRVTPQVGNATCNVGGKLLKIVEMQQRYGTSGPGGMTKQLNLADVPVSG